MLPRSSEEHTGDRLFDFLVSVDAGSNGSINFFTYLGVFAHGFENLFLLIGILKIASFFKFFVSSDVEVAFGKIFKLEVLDEHYSSDSDSVSWHTFPHILSVGNQTISTRDLAGRNVLRILLDLQ